MGALAARVEALVEFESGDWTVWRREVDRAWREVVVSIRLLGEAHANRYTFGRECHAVIVFLEL
jgi:hypothetical protein